MWLILLFVILQLADGIFTFIIVGRYGLSAELNPLLIYFFIRIGIIKSLVLGKLLAVGIFVGAHFIFQKIGRRDSFRSVAYFLTGIYFGVVIPQILFLIR